MPNTIQDRLNEALLARGMTPAELARAIGVGNGYVSKLLAGYISQPKKNLSAICQALRITETWLITGKGHAELEPDQTLEERNCIQLKFENREDEDTKDNYITCLYSNETEKLAAYIVSPSANFDSEVAVIIDKSRKGSGLFLIEFESELFISTRIDNLVNILWIHNTGKDIPDGKFKVLGKIVQLLEMKEDDLWP
ncbi:helix-turn-helix domain-containing protein [Serratia sp. TSA_130.2]|uniref:helix-turn-helix domain-containing protein n=1 Tax=Serratia TaxID=613 RepID=UPI0021A569FD|nr:helix-turn-helix transcriptional regulator [Serratia ureilytica]MCT2272600.1 helix-turn-helix transcriptional regulator [Serratia ureilytica]